MMRTSISIAFMISVVACANESPVDRDLHGDNSDVVLPVDDAGAEDVVGDPGVEDVVDDAGVEDVVDDAGVEDVVDPGTNAHPVLVKLLGANAPGAVWVRVAALEVRMDQDVVATAPSDVELDLGSETPSHLSTFDLNVGAAETTLTLTFQPEGTVVRSGDTVPLDLRGPPISFVGDVGQMRTTGQVILEIDLARSLIDHEDHVILLPYFSIAY